MLSRPFVRILGILLGLIVWMANSFNPPNGRTNAPFDGSCSNCHSGGSFNGNVVLSGLPGTVEANTTYNLTLTMTPISGSPELGGFQLVVVDNNFNDAGDLISINSETGTELFGNREYIEHRGSKTFGGGPISWDFNWTAPATVGGGNVIRVYYIGNFTNGNGSTSGDIAFSDLDTYGFQPASSPVMATISTFQNISCFGGNDGSVTVQASGGTPPYNYLWSNGQTTQTAVNLAAGTYSVTVSDQASSTAAASRTLTQPTNINVLTSVSGIITCAQPTATISATATGGVQPYQFEWSNGANGPSTVVNTPGLYTVTLTDINGCTKTGQVTVSSNTLFPAAVAAAPGPLTCANATIILSGQGSSQGANIIYSWTGPGIVSGANTLSPVVNQPGLYTLLVINTSNGCSSSASVSVTQNIAAPTSNTINGVLNCFQFQDTLIVSSPDTTATFIWSGPGNFSATADTIVADTQGLYIVTVTGANGCTSLDTAVLSLDTTPPPLTVTNGHLSCLMPTDTLIASTDSVPATIAWQSGPAGWVVVADTVVVSQPGLYFVTATAANGCTTVDTAVVTQNPVLETLLDTVINVSCFGGDNGAISVLVSGGLSPYQIIWSNGQTGQDINNLVAGNYVWTVIDAEGCLATDTITVTQPSQLLANASATPETGNGANDGTATAQPSGGVGPYLFFWDTGDTAQTITNLPPGTYTPTVTDANGCTVAQPVTVNPFNCVISATATVTNVTCFGVADGAILFVVDSPNGDTTISLTNLQAGTYPLSYTDGAGCNIQQNIQVSAPAQIVMAFDVTDVTCTEDKDGAVNIAVTGGVSPYNYTITGGMVPPNDPFVLLGVGEYQVTVVDANGCIGTGAFEVVATDSQPPVLTCIQQWTVCLGDTIDYTLPVATDNCDLGGAEPVLQFGLPYGSVMNQFSSTQIYEITDNNGNKSTCAISLIGAENPQPTLVSVTNDLNNSGSGTITIDVGTSDPSLKLEWFKDGLPFPVVGNPEVLTGLFAGLYSVFITSELTGCTGSLGPIEVKNTVSAVDPYAVYGIRFMPNPVTDRFTVDWGSFEPLSGRLFNSKGMLVQNLESVDLTNPMSFSFLPAGWYGLWVQDARGNSTVIRFNKL